MPIYFNQRLFLALNTKLEHNLKSLFLSCAIAALSPLTAMADASTPTNWSGFYSGISASQFSGDVTALVGGAVVTQADMSSKTVAGAFGGYNWQKGNLVYGGELAYSNLGQSTVGFPNSILEDVFDVKLRGGYATGKTLFYGVIGGSWSEFNDAGNTFNQSGMNYGIGIDFAATNNIVLGVEYLVRDVSDTVGIATLENDIRSISARVSWKF